MNINAQRVNNKSKKIIFSMTTLFLLIVLVGWFIVNGFFGPYNPENVSEYSVSVKQGLSTAQIGQILTNEKIIANQKYFELFVRLNKMDGKLKAGDYTLSPSMSLEEIVDRLMKGQTITYKFTIPEGYIFKQICEVLVKKGLAEEENFWRVVQEEPFDQFEFLKDLPKDEKRLEGYLFPD